MTDTVAVTSLADATAPPQLELVVPVLDEERDLAPSIRRLHAYLTARFPFTWRITIVDNGSTDGTWAEATWLAATLPGVHVLHLDERGRGRALRRAWLASDAAVVAYTDVDLSTDLDALAPLVSAILSGHSELAIGSRLLPGSRIVRGPKRELISRTYNLLLRLVFRTRIHDAQCGFKAVRADVARQLVPLVEDQGWFFDTELLLLAQRRGLRVLEVPVDWVDDPDSRVRVMQTALDDLRGIARMIRRFLTGEVPRAPLPPGLARQLVSFAGIGVVSTFAHLLLFVVLRAPLGAIAANIVALAITAVANTLANRRLTFGVVGRTDRWRHLVEASAVFVLTTTLSTAALAGLRVVLDDPATIVDVVTIFTVQLIATLIRFLTLRHWVFAPRRRGVAA